MDFSKNKMDLQVLFIISVFVKDDITASKFLKMVECLHQCESSLPITFVAAGHIHENFHDLWTTFTARPYKIHTIPFSTNTGKSSYIDAAIQWANHNHNEYQYIATMDCDIQIRNISFNLLIQNMISVLTDTSGKSPDCGIVAPNQTGSNKHLSTIYQHRIDTGDQIIYWSELHPSIAGGCWLFSKTTYDKIGPFQNVGSYGPEDVLFAWDVVQKLHIRCYLIENISVYHPP